FNSKIIKDSVEFIKNSASSFGFTFIQIDPQMTINEENKTVDITFNIDEGPKVYIKRININGNSRTIDKVIRRELSFSEGDAYNKFSINYSKDKIRSLNFLKVLN
ncbi:MAG: POTRA domain-containing protein, partial [Candidatus Pelagibacterales bacterium]